MRATPKAPHSAFAAISQLYGDVGFAENTGGLYPSGGLERCHMPQCARTARAPAAGAGAALELGLPLPCHTVPSHDQHHAVRFQLRTRPRGAGVLYLGLSPLRTRARRRMRMHVRGHARICMSNRPWPVPGLWIWVAFVCAEMPRGPRAHRAVPLSGSKSPLIRAKTDGDIGITPRFTPVCCAAHRAPVSLNLSLGARSLRADAPVIFIVRDLGSALLNPHLLFSCRFRLVQQRLDLHTQPWGYKHAH